MNAKEASEAGFLQALIDGKELQVKELRPGSKIHTFWYTTNQPLFALVRLNVADVRIKPSRSQKVDPSKGWVSVKRQLPSKSHDKVLVALATGYVTTDYISNGRWVSNSAMPNSSPVTHWRLLPEPPKKTK